MLIFRLIYHLKGPKSFLSIQFDLCEGLGKCMVERLFRLFLLLLHITPDVRTAYVLSFSLPSVFKGSHLLFVTTDADKGLCLSLTKKFHPLVSDRTTGIGRPGDCLSVSALSVLADKHFAVLSVYGKHSFTTARALPICKIVMPKCPLTCTNVR